MRKKKEVCLINKLTINQLIFILKGEIGPYDELISQFTSTDIQEFEKLKPWLDALSNVVSQLDKSHLSLVEAIMSISWTVSSHSFVQTYKTFVFMLVSAHPGYIKLLLGKLIKGFTHRTLISLIIQI